MTHRAVPWGSSAISSFSLGHLGEYWEAGTGFFIQSRTCTWAGQDQARFGLDPRGPAVLPASAHLGGGDQEDIGLGHGILQELVDHFGAAAARGRRTGWTSWCMGASNYAALPCCHASAGACSRGKAKCCCWRRRCSRRVGDDPGGVDVDAQRRAVAVVPLVKLILVELVGVALQDMAAKSGRSRQRMSQSYMHS